MAKKNTKDKKTTNKRKKKLSSSKVVVNIQSSYNNTIVNVSTLSGQTVTVTSAGSVGFTGSKKSTGYAATLAGERAAEEAMKQGASECVIRVKGMGIGRQAAVKGVRSAGLKITSLSDFTPIPHGGCKPRKKPKK